MNLENWLAFTLAYIVISIIPGPSVFMVLGQSMAHGMRAAIFCILGDLAGGVVVMSASYLGLGFVLAASSEAFLVLKWLGVAYMAYLGVSQLLAAHRLNAFTPIEQTNISYKFASARAGFITGVLNPKAIMFYVAFFAQFINPSSSTGLQFIILMLTSTVIVAVVLGLYAIFASQLRVKLQTFKAQKRMGYLGGSFLLGGSALMASTR